MATKTMTSPTRPELPEETLKERWTADFDELGDELKAADRWVRSFARQRPLAALAGAMAAGFVAGRIISRI